MRLIDADKLDVYEMRFRSALELQDYLDTKPTIDPVKHGRWINHRNDDGHNIADCNQCGNAIQWFDGDEIPRYCCMCGTKMEGADNDKCR